jgi:hypothetical protein
VKLNKLKDHTQKIHVATSTSALVHQYHNAVKLAMLQLVIAQLITHVKSVKLNSSNLVVAKLGLVNATLLKSLNDVSKEVKSTKSMNTSGKTQPKDVRVANVKKNSSTVKSRPSLDVMLDKLVMNFLKPHQLVSSGDTRATKNSHNASPSVTSHGDVVPEESGLVTETSKVVMKLVALNAQAVAHSIFQSVDQLKILSKNFTLQIQKRKNVNVFNTTANVIQNFVVNQANARKVLPLFTAWMRTTVVKF